MNAHDQTTLLWKTIYGGGRGFLALFAGERPGQTAGGPKGRLRGTRTAFFDYPAGAADAAGWGLASSRRGLESYFCAHLLTARSRTKDAAAPVLALWADADGPPPPGGPEPTAVVESSPGRAHLFWRLKRPLSPAAAEALNRRMALSLDADPSGWDLSQLLRPPGTRNRKYGGAPAVKLVELDEGAVYHPRELDLALPALPEPPAAPAAVAREPVGLRPAAPPDDLARLSARAMGLVRAGNAGAGSPYPSRSEADFAVCLAMFSAGYDEAEVRAVLTDPSNGISEKYLEKGRHGARYLALTIRNARPKARGKSRKNGRTTGGRRPAAA